ncbi:MAG: hypothetical protein LBO73_04075 [Holosporaceae bacterium]|jgi:hypothetical protein|nr:hypothetical protein [Holosporaceae bacterium]
MKRIVFSAILAVPFFAFGAITASGDKHHGEKHHGEKHHGHPGAAEEGHHGGKHHKGHHIKDHKAFAGPFVGLGIAARTVTLDNRYEVDSYATADATGDAVSHTYREAGTSQTVLAGSFVCGIGKAVKRGYIGLDLGLDFGPKAENTPGEAMASVARLSSVRLTSGGINPYVALRAGIFNGHGAVLVYTRFGGIYTRVKEEYTGEILNDAGDLLVDESRHSEFPKSSFRPFVTVGVEQLIGQHESLRLELDGIWGKAWTKNHKDEGAAAVGQIPAYSIRHRTKLTQKFGLTARLMYCWHVKLFH